MINRAGEFDGLVNKLNDYMDNSKSQKRNWRTFLNGMGSVLNLVGNSFSYRNHHPIYSRKDLSPEQKDAINLASDFKRTLKRLENVELDLFDKAEKRFASEMYDHYRNLYISYQKD